MSALFLSLSCYYTPHSDTFPLQRFPSRTLPLTLTFVFFFLSLTQSLSLSPQKNQFHMIYFSAKKEEQVLPKQARYCCHSFNLRPFVTHFQFRTKL